MTTRIYVPKDTTANALGAERVARAITQLAQERGDDIEIIRNGSRGAFWLEPMVEVATNQGRIAYGPVQPGDVPELFAAGFTAGAEHRLRIGPPEEIPYLQKQQRLTFRRAGVIDPVSVADYQAHGGFAGLANAVQLPGQALVDEVKASGLRGRGGAAFPAGIKWQTVHDAPGPCKYIVCNADEGDSGTFADRLLMEADPLTLVEGMVIAGLAVGAEQGYIYLRSEYPLAHAVLNQAIAAAREQGFVGEDILGTGKCFELEVRLGAGAYICGEETSLLESLEGRRGLVRAKPPLPALEGLFGKHTLVHNVLSLAAVPFILAEGAAAYANYGQGRSLGTMPFQLAGNIQRGGLVELAFGVGLHTLVNDFGGGTDSGRPVRAIQVGGPLGAYLPQSQWQTPMDYEAFSEMGAVLGHGGIVVFDDSVDMLAQARFAMEFCVAESCGKCTPCRIGSTRGVEVIDRIAAGINADANQALLDDLCQTMVDGSLCAMGSMTPIPVQSAVKHFPEDFSPATAAGAN